METICKKIKSILNSHNYINELPDKVEEHLVSCHSCNLVLEDTLRLKETVKRAVENTSVSEELVHLIMNKIKESETSETSETTTKSVLELEKSNE